MAEKQLSSAKLEFVPNGKENNAAVGPKGRFPFESVSIWPGRFPSELIPQAFLTF